MTSEKRVYLTVPRPVWRRMLQIGHRLDVSGNPPGLYDARSMAINLWVSPEDKPPSWEGIEITRGVFPEPREYLGAIEMDLEHPDTHEARLVLDCTPYERAKRDGHSEGHSYPTPLADEWDWLEKKANDLLALAEAELKPQEEPDAQI